jgi:hypothetical protein
MSKGDFENKINPTRKAQHNLISVCSDQSLLFSGKVCVGRQKIKYKFKKSFGQSYGGLLRNSSEQVVVKKELKFSSSDLKTQHEKSKPNLQVFFSKGRKSIIWPLFLLYQSFLRSKEQATVDNNTKQERRGEKNPEEKKTNKQNK